MPTVNFSIDSALLKELGERLVGKPYIALAELAKNGYDADSHEVIINLDTIKDQIIITDFGHGMDENEFRNLWMRVGSTHKEKIRFSRNLHRLMTGSKGVGRLAVQFLAKSMTLITTSENDLNRQLVATIVWEKAVNRDNLNEVQVQYDIKESKGSFEKGTSIILQGLKHTWTQKEIEGLASELWWLQPPFRAPSRSVENLENQEDEAQNFIITFKSPFSAYEKIFNEQMESILNIWVARIVGNNEKGKVNITLEYNGETPVSYYYEIKNCELSEADWEIRIYNLHNRQPHKIKVDQARQYFNSFGGVHVYDKGFHLPYYGDPRNDWLRIEIDHSHRLTLSELLPKELQTEQGLMFLPTTSRLFGVVNVDTAKEKNLKILITRDRLQETDAFQNLQNMVRYGLDLYAMEEKKRSMRKALIHTEVERPKIMALTQTLEKYENEIPEEIYQNLKRDVESTVEEFKVQSEQAAEQVSLVGPLATAGISSLAYQHELNKQFGLINDIILQLTTIKTDNAELQVKLNKLATDLSSWVQRARATNSLFAYFASAENSAAKERFPAKKVIDDIKQQVSVLARDTEINTDELDEKIYLPKASLVEWGAIFQNVFINAFNAVVDSEKKLIKVSSINKWEDKTILVQDTGVGVDLNDSENLFQPFVRKLRISEERKSLGYGGMGLGLTIVRMIANNINCTVRFVPPEEGFKSAFCLRWREIL